MFGSLSQCFRRFGGLWYWHDLESREPSPSPNEGGGGAIFSVLAGHEVVRNGPQAEQRQREAEEEARREVEVWIDWLMDLQTDRLADWLID